MVKCGEQAYNDWDITDVDWDMLDRVMNEVWFPEDSEEEPACDHGTVVTDDASGEAFFWKYEKETATMFIWGSGRISDYCSSDPDTPWKHFRDSIRKVVIEEGITAIGVKAFWCYPNIEEVTIPWSVTDIGCFAFENCSSLKTVHLQRKPVLIELLPERENAPEDSIVFGLGALEYTPWSDANGIYLEMCKEMGFCWSFDENTGILRIWGTGKIPDYYRPTPQTPWRKHREDIRTVVIEEGITAIGMQAFYGYPAIEEVFIPESVTYIGYCAFANCPLLETVHLKRDPFAPRKLFARDNAFHLTLASGSFDNTPWSRKVEGYKREPITVEENYQARVELFNKWFEQICSYDSEADFLDDCKEYEVRVYLKHDEAERRVVVCLESETGNLSEVVGWICLDLFDEEEGYIPAYEDICKILMDKVYGREDNPLRADDWIGLEKHIDDFIEDYGLRSR